VEISLQFHSYIMYNALLGAPLLGVDQVSVGVMAVSCSHFCVEDDDDHHLRLGD
jgi:hypothetical protein